MTDRQQAIDEAERAIATILRDLELTTGDIVEQVTLRYHNISITDGPPRNAMMVSLDLVRRPGNEWGQAR